LVFTASQLDVQHLKGLVWRWWCYPTPSEGWGAWRNSTDTQQSGHSPRSGPKVKNGRSGAEDGAPERLGCEIVKEEVSQILQRVSAGAA